MTAHDRACVVKASGDDVGNNGAATVLRCADGTTRLSVENHRGQATVWLLPSQAVALATALLVAAKADPSVCRCSHGSSCHVCEGCEDHHEPACPRSAPVEHGTDQ